LKIIEISSFEREVSNIFSKNVMSLSLLVKKNGGPK